MHDDQLAAAAGNESFDFVLSECQQDGTKLAGVDGVPYIIVTLNLEPDETVDVEFKNVYVEDLAISKTVDEDANEEDAAKIWGFEVKLSSPDLADFAASNELCFGGIKKLMLAR